MASARGAALWIVAAVGYLALEAVAEAGIEWSPELRENTAMLQMCRALGFTIRADAKDPGLVRVTKPLQKM